MQIQLKKNHGRYAKYKSTGIPWPNEVPEGWDFQRLRFVIQLNPSKSKVVKLDENLPVSFIPMEAVSEDGVMQSGEIRPMKEVKEGYTFFQGNDVLMAKITPCFENGKGAVAENLHNNIGFGSTEFLVLRGGNKISPELLWYLISSHWFRSTGEVEMRGSAGQKRVPERFVKDFLVGLPPKPVQSAIVNYLDEKSLLIERIIEAKQKQIELLKEKRSALINRAVTQGIDEDVEMKDSGVEWIGKVPIHWEVTRMRYLAKKINSGVTPKGGAESYIDEGIPLIRSLNVYSDGFRWEDLAFIDRRIYESMSNSQLQIDDVLLNITGASIGRSYYFSGEFPEANVNQHVCILRLKKSVLTKFIHYFLISKSGQEQIDLVQMGTSREGLNYQQIRNFDITVPPNLDQQKIVEYLEKEMRKIDIALQKIQQSIDLLREYKTSLVASVVTGKVKLTVNP